MSSYGSCDPHTTCDCRISSRPSMNFLLESSDDLFSCSSFKSKLSCIGCHRKTTPWQQMTSYILTCIRAHKVSTAAWLIASSFLFRAFTTFIPRVSRKLLRWMSESRNTQITFVVTLVMRWMPQILPLMLPVSWGHEIVLLTSHCWSTPDHLMK